MCKHTEFSFAYIFIFLSVCVLTQTSFSDDTIQPGFVLTASNFDHVMNTYNSAFVNFYVDWCHFSRKLKPTFIEVAENVSQSEAGKQNRMKLLFVDCEVELDLCNSYNVKKYPTMLIFRYGKKGAEYRGGRSKESLLEYIESELKDPILYHAEHLNASQFHYSAGKRYIIGYIHLEDNKLNPNITNFQKMASILRSDCEFIHTNLRHPNQDNVTMDRVRFHNGESVNETDYEGSLQDFNELYWWTVGMCTPLVRELTFENAEEMFEEGLPLFILFYNPLDELTPSTFRETARKGLKSHRGKVNLLTADGSVFSHPLRFIEKTKEDLPVLVIDSLVHIFLYPNDVRQAINDSSLLNGFLEDLYSDKLHKNYHSSSTPDVTIELQSNDKSKTSDESNEEDDEASLPETPQPKESVFKKLGPSHYRYTFRNYDEL